MTNSLNGVTRWRLGWYDEGLTEKDHKRINGQAKTLLVAMNQGKPVAQKYREQAEKLERRVWTTKIAVAAFKDEQDEHEKTMLELLPALPPAALAYRETVKGFGEMTLLVMIGEAGNLSDYPNVAKVWKRLGFAPAETYPQGEKSKGRKIPKSRKGTIWGMLIPQILKQQVATIRDDNGKDTGVREPRGPYGAFYLEHKAAYLARFTADGTKAPKVRAHEYAARRVIKRVLKELWKAWNGHVPAEDHAARAD